MVKFEVYEQVMGTIETALYLGIIEAFCISEAYEKAEKRWPAKDIMIFENDIFP